MVQLPASEIIGLKIYGSNKEPVGQVTELVLNYKGQAEGLVIGLEGGSWRSKKYVLLPYSEASFQNKNGSLESVTVPYTLGQLQKLPMSSFPMLQKNYDGKLEAASPTSGPGMDPAGPGMERKK
jgi:sporulation protein YlmC with PRC-barrel domain